MDVNIVYSVSYGPGDGSEAIDASIELLKDEEELYSRALESGRSLNSCPELQPILQRAWDEIAEAEFQNSLQMQDCYALDCAGLLEMDSALLNRLVRSGDSHALEFFGLSGRDPQSLSDWDASRLEKLPLRKDFEENFSPLNPFTRGWSLELEFCEDEEPEDDFAYSPARTPGCCSECGAEDVDVVMVDEDCFLCEDCLEELDYIQCDRCRRYWPWDALKFYHLRDGRCICENCADELMEDELLSEEDIESVEDYS